MSRRGRGRGRALAQLADPERYRACASDLLIDAQARSSWLSLFRRQGVALLRTAHRAGYALQACRDAEAALMSVLDGVEQKPDRHGRLDILLLDELRDAVLRAHGIDDAYRAVKAAENERSLALLPQRVQRLSSARREAHTEALVQGLLEGNLFDMGAMLTAAHYADDHDLQPESSAQADPPRVPLRPWRYDDVETFHHLLHGGCGHAVIFVDNAGADAVLGVLPLASHLVSIGVRVTLAANAQPSLNDVTASELQGLVDRATGVLPGLGSGLVCVRSTGSAAPLIDLSVLDADFVEEVRDADLIVLLGMGRALESNWHVPFTVPVVHIAMVKDPEVARTVSASLLDAVCRVTSPVASARPLRSSSGAPAAPSSPR